MSAKAQIDWNPSDWYLCLKCGCLVNKALKAVHTATHVTRTQE